jgi:hypothetical protein
MSRETIDIFCAACNVLVSAKVRAEVHGGFRSSAADDSDMSDAEYHGEHYILALCGRCNGPFLVRESLFGIPGEFETVTEEAVLYPASDRLALGDLPASVQRAHEQAVRAFGVALYEPSALMCRKALEAVCKLKGASGRNLYDRLAELAKSGVIDARLLEWAHEIRVVGNDAAHDPDGEVSKDDARDVLDLTEAILLYVFSLTARFDRFRVRRATPTPPQPGSPAG